MNRILEIDLANERAVVQPGVVNLDITVAVEADGYFYAPDPSSQRACTIGGNVSENCRRTAHAALTESPPITCLVSKPCCRTAPFIKTSTKAKGYDFTGLLVGSEGTMVLVTKVIVRLMRKPEMVKTILAIYDRAEDAGDTVERDHRSRDHSRRDRDDGRRDAPHDRGSHARRLSDGRGGRAADRARRTAAKRWRSRSSRFAKLACRVMRAKFRVARNAMERDLLWKGRKNAFGAVGRVSPAYYVQDGVVPRTQIAPTLKIHP